MISQEELMKKIVSDSGRSESEIKLMADTKRAQLSNMITYHGALMIVASELGVKVDSKPEVDVEIPEEIEMTGATEIRSDSNVEDLDLDDLGKKFLASPRVGMSVDFTLAKIQKSKNIDAVDKSGKKFKTNLTSVDYKIVYVTKNGEEFSCKSWECVGKINSICKKLKKIDGVELRVTHIKDGMKEKEGENYKVETKIDSKWRELDRKTFDWK